MMTRLNPEAIQDGSIPLSKLSTQDITIVYKATDTVVLNNANSVKSHSFDEIAGTGRVVLNSSNIPDRLFRDSSIFEVEIPDSVTSIGSAAFEACLNTLCINSKFIENDWDGGCWWLRGMTSRFSI